MSAQQPYSPIPGGHPLVVPIPDPPEYSRRLVLNLAGSGTTLGVSSVVHTLVPAHHAVNETAGLPAAPSVTLLAGSATWLVGVLGLIATRELRYGFNRMFPRVQIVNNFYNTQQPIQPRGARRRPQAANPQPPRTGTP